MKESEICSFIDGKNITLTPLNSGHAAIYAKWQSLPNVRLYSRNIMPKTPDDIKKWLEPTGGRVKKDVGFEIWHKKDKKLIGECGVNDINWYDMKAFLGLVVGESEYWGQNICTDATNLLVEYAFNELNLNKLYADIFSPNKGSYKCVEKNGFTREAVFKKDVFIEGVVVDTYCYSLLKEDLLKQDT